MEPCCGSPDASPIRCPLFSSTQHELVKQKKVGVAVGGEEGTVHYTTNKSVSTKNTMQILRVLSLS